MRIPTSTAILLAATLSGTPVLAQGPVSPQRQLSALIRQDAALRDRIGRIQLDALVARVDQTIDRRTATARAGRGGSLRHDLDLSTF